jgi:hypothetical protein
MLWFAIKWSVNINRTARVKHEVSVWLKSANKCWAQWKVRMKYLICELPLKKYLYLYNKSSKCPPWDWILASTHVSSRAAAFVQWFLSSCRYSDWNPQCDEESCHSLLLSFWTLSIVRISTDRKHNVSETGSVSVFRRGGGHLLYRKPKACLSTGDARRKEGQPLETRGL